MKSRGPTSAFADAEGWAFDPAFPLCLVNRALLPSARRALVRHVCFDRAWTALVRRYLRDAHAEL